MKILSDAELNGCGVRVSHHFSDNEYAKRVDIPAGTKLEQHLHPYSHLSILASGKVLLSRDDTAIEVQGPACLTIPAHVAHGVTALTDSVWYCIHATEEKDHTKVDKAILNG